MADLPAVLGAAFPDLARKTDSVLAVRAPGRVNLLGEHTDYNEGLVLPLAISVETTIAFVPAVDDTVELVSTTTGEREGFSLSSIPPRRGSWVDYVCGVALELRRSGNDVGGLRGVIASSVPMSAGLSSSAALELAAAWALLASAGGARSRPEPDCLALAMACQRAENDYVGVASGLMDQFSSSCGVAGAAVLLDCRSLAYRSVAIPDELDVVVVDTGSRRRLAASEYNARRADCERGVEILARRGEPVRSLRDATLAMLDAAAANLGEALYRRCRHVVDENARVAAAVSALENRDYRALGELFSASHASLRDLYDVSSPELDEAVEIAAATPFVIASRMTGAGFGGCTVNLVHRGRAAELRAAFEERYRPRGGVRATVFAVSAVDGAGLVTV